LALISRSKFSFSSYYSPVYYVIFSHLATLFHPGFFPTPLQEDPLNLTIELGFEKWQVIFYFGIIPLVLAIIGSIFGWKRKYTKVLIISFLVSLFLPISIPLLHLLYEFFPGFALFRSPGRMFFIGSFFGVLLAGIGVDEILKRLQNTNKKVLINLFTVGLIGVVALEGIYYSHKYTSTINFKEILSQNEYLEIFEKDKDKFRVAPIYRTITFGWAESLGLEIVSGYDPINLNSYAKYFYLIRGDNPRDAKGAFWLTLQYIKRQDLLDILNVKYLVSNNPLSFNNYELIAHYRRQSLFYFYWGVLPVDIFVYKNKFFVERAFYVDNVIGVKNESEAIEKIHETDLRETAVVLGAKEGFVHIEHGKNNSIEIQKVVSGYLDIDTSVEDEQFLVISEIWHPGWKAYLDGKEVPIYRTDLTLMGILVPPGTHSLMMEFMPPNFYLGLYISIISGAILIICVLIYIIRSRKLAS